MSYIHESLAPQETLIYLASFHWLQKARAYISLGALAAGAIAVLVLVQSLPGLIGAAILAVLAATTFVSMMVPFWTTEIGVTNRRFIFKRGWLRRKTDELQLNSIEEVNLEQSAVGRLLGYGRLVLHGTGVNDVTLPTLANPVELRRALQQGMTEARASVVLKPATGEGESSAAA